MGSFISWKKLEFFSKFEKPITHGHARSLKSGRFSAHGGRTQTPLNACRLSPAIIPINGRSPIVAVGADSARYAVRVRADECTGQFRLCQIAIAVSRVAAVNLVRDCRSEENLDNSALSRMVCLDGSGNGEVTKRMSGGAPANWKWDLLRR